MKTFPPKIVYTTVLSVFLIFCSGALLAQVKIGSWNVQNFGKSKSAAEIEFVANTVKEFDIIALQEVVAGYGGAQAVAKRRKMGLCY